MMLTEIEKTFQLRAMPTHKYCNAPGLQVPWGGRASQKSLDGEVFQQKKVFQKGKKAICVLQAQERQSTPQLQRFVGITGKHFAS